MEIILFSTRDCYYAATRDDGVGWGAKRDPLLEICTDMQSQPASQHTIGLCICGPDDVVSVYKMLYIHTSFCGTVYANSPFDEF